MFVEIFLNIFNNICPSRLTTNTSFVRRGKSWSSDVGNCGNTKYKQGHGGVWRQVVGFVPVRLAGIKLQTPWRWIDSLVNAFNKVCTFNAIRNNNAAINCTATQHKISQPRQLCWVMLPYLLMSFCCNRVHPIDKFMFGCL